MFGGVWSYVAAAGLAIAVATGIYQTGYHAAMRKAQVATITAERDAAKRDLEASTRAALEARSQAATIAASEAANRRKVQELADALKKADANGACRLGDFARRLQSIR